MLPLPRVLQWIGIASSVAVIGGWIIAHLSSIFLIACLLWLVVLGLSAFASKLSLAQLRQSASALLSTAKGASAPSSSPPAPAPKSARPTIKPKAALDQGMDVIRALHGLDTVRFELENLFATYSAAPSGGGDVRKGTLILLLGPRGTGRSTVARSLALMLYGEGLIKNPDPVVIEADEARAIGHADIFSTFQAKAVEAVDGVLLLDNAEWLTEGAGAIVGRTISKVSDEYPHRLTVVLVGKTGLREELFRNQETRSAWFSRLSSREVIFPALDTQALGAILAETARRNGVRLSDGVHQKMVSVLADQSRRDGFENAVAAQGLFDDVRRAAAVRASRNNQSASEFLLTDVEEAAERLHQ